MTAGMHPQRTPGREVMARLGLTAAAAICAGCSGVQSALAPSGYNAERIANLFWWMTGGAVVVWVFVVALALYPWEEGWRFRRSR